jgi:hypothetical protein
LKFLIGVILAFVALSLAPALLSQGGSAWAVGLGILLLFFVGPGIVSWLVGAAFGSRVGGFLVFGLILFFMANPRACPGLPRGLGGDAGQIVELASVRFLAESDYDECVQGYIRKEDRNAALAEDALACQAEADRAVASCLGRIGNTSGTSTNPVRVVLK